MKLVLNLGQLLTTGANEFSDLAKKIEDPLRELMSSTTGVVSLGNKRALVELLKLVNEEAPNSTNQAKLAEIKSKISSGKKCSSEKSYSLVLF